MYSYIKGSLEEIEEDSVVVDNQGIGYRIFVPGRMLERLPAKGSEVKIYTHLHVKEDAFTLFGFLSRDERTLFRLMLNVSGIGPKGALGILTVLDPDELRRAVMLDDAKAIAKAPGVGSKTAQKLIIELKDKVHLEELLPETETMDAQLWESSRSQVIQEAVEALASLGYSSREAEQAVAKIELSEDMDVEAVLKVALKQMAFL